MTVLRSPVTSRDHIQGPDDAIVTLVEYGDYQCPYCGLAHPIVKQIQTRFADRLRFVFRHFPLREVHPLAEPAAETAEFAGSHGRFWPMHDAIYENQHQLSVPLLVALAASLKLSPIALRDAFASGTYADKVQADFIGGVRSGVNGTPTFFINGVRHDSPLGVMDLAAAIEQTVHAMA